MCLLQKNGMVMKLYYEMDISKIVDVEITKAWYGEPIEYEK